jgi:hypothetical protein
MEALNQRGTHAHGGEQVGALVAFLAEAMQMLLPA